MDERLWLWNSLRLVTFPIHRSSSLHQGREYVSTNIEINRKEAKTKLKQMLTLMPMLMSNANANAEADADVDAVADADAEVDEEAI